jgi:hypothetical protein
VNSTKGMPVDVAFPVCCDDVVDDSAYDESDVTCDGVHGSEAGGEA